MNFAGKRVLLLQGPIGPFFRRLGQDLQAQGATVFKINFNAGDALFYPQRALAYRRSLAEWPRTLQHFLRTQRIDAIFLFGDCRPVHVCVRDVAAELGVAVGVFEEGYLRPDFLTLEPTGVNGHSLFMQDMNWLQSSFAELESKPESAQPAPALEQQVGSTYGRAAFYGMVYFFAAWLLQWFWNKELLHRRMSPADAPLWWLSYGRKFWYAIKEWGIQQHLTGKRRKRFFLVPLQVHNDAQISVHSSYQSVCQFAHTVLRSYAKALAHEREHGAPAGGESIASCKLVFKHHPMDRGHRQYGRVLKTLARRYGLERHILYIHDQHLPSLLKASRGVIVVNSTTGISALHHGAPVKVCGVALYDLPGLTFQGPLQAFWHHARQAAPDPVVLAYFRRKLIQRTQLNGSFYRRLKASPWRSGVDWGQNLRRLAARIWPESMAEKPTNGA